MNTSNEGTETLELSAEFLTFTKELYESDPDGPFARFLKLSMDQSSLVFASAALRRVELLFQLIFDQEDVPRRFAGDEFVFQGLRPAIDHFTTIPDFLELRPYIRAAMPDRLEGLRRNWTPGCWEAELRPALDMLTSELHAFCVAHRVSPFHPGPDPLFRAQDEYLALIQEQDQGGRRIRRPVLSLHAESWLPYRGKELQGALDALATLREIIHIRFPLPGWIALIPDEDGGLHETLIQDIEFLLSDMPELLEEIRPLIPGPDLFTPNDIELYDSETVNSFLGDLERARILVRRELLASGDMMSDRLPPFSMFDDELAADKERALQEARTHLQRVGITPPKEKQEAETDTRRRGRPTGSGWTIADIRELLQRYLETTDAPDRNGFLASAGLSESTFRRVTRNAGTNWTSLIRGARNAA